jgi:hypothetical protein
MQWGVRIVTSCAIAGMIAAMADGSASAQRYTGHKGRITNCDQYVALLNYNYAALQRATAATKERLNSQQHRIYGLWQACRYREASELADANYVIARSIGAGLVEAAIDYGRYRRSYVSVPRGVSAPSRQSRGPAVAPTRVPRAQPGVRVTPRYW